ncbi:MAG TPA: nucleotidyl transferase AbiEii/AbiGii toxin family protein [Trebonia sp.]|nr:nucleotidyl transferase AbiEii/AbiGii toxin family protein [Trebonia sp.]
MAAGAPGTGTGAGNGPRLTAFQAQVARLFFALPESKGFLLAGGAALLAQHLTARPTEDLDFFTAPECGHVPAARDALEAAARDRGWSTERIHDSDTFSRLVIRGDDAGVLVDLAVSAPPDLPASVTAAGPTLAPEELAGHKLLALFDRAAARDFADVYMLALRFGKDVLLARAAQIDAGFDAEVLAGMIATLDRFTDSEIPVPEGLTPAELRAFYATWRSELSA